MFTLPLFKFQSNPKSALNNMQKRPGINPGVKELQDKTLNHPSNGSAPAQLPFV